MTAPIKLLYVEDDAGLAHLLTRALGPRGIVVTHVETGDAAFAALNTNAYDVIALDYNLAGETGLDILAKLRALPDAPPVVFVTGSDDARVAVAALKGGAIDYVWKDTEGHYRELLVESALGAIEQVALRREKQAADKALQQAKDRAETLLAEVNHRIANSLMLVASMARLQANASGDGALKQALSEMQARINAVANVHRHLYANNSNDVRRVELSAYLKSLTDDSNASLGSPRIRFTPSVAPVFVKSDHAVALGVIANELVTNALKYAYDGADGEIRVGVAVEQERGELVVEDDGKGWTGAGPAIGTGVGSRIIQAMASSLNAQLTYATDNGTRARVSFPLMP